MPKGRLAYFDLKLYKDNMYLEISVFAIGRRISAGLVDTSDRVNSIWNYFSQCPGGGIGRHVGLRSQYRKMCRFKSCPGYQFSVRP